MSMKKGESRQELLNRALTHDEFLNKLKITLKETQSLIQISGGDARKLLNLLELTINSMDKESIVISNDLVIDLSLIHI